MPVKSTHTKHDKPEDLVINHIPDVFDEAASETPAVGEPVREPLIVEAPVAETAAPEPKAAEPDLPQPSLPETNKSSFKEEITPEVVTSKPEPELPAFFTQEAKAPVTPAPEITPPPQEESVVITPEVNAAAEQMIQTTMPQAVVGEIGEVAAEAKSEKKGLLITVFIIGGMVLVAAGLVGLYFVSTHKSVSSLFARAVPTPTPVVVPTPIATPTVIVHEDTATPAATLDLTAAKKTTKVNVLNGTKTAGLAAKAAALLKQAKFTLGTVGNGTPAAAGTIVVPTGLSDLASQIEAALPTFTFTSTESSKVKEITVTLSAPVASATPAPTP